MARNTRFFASVALAVAVVFAACGGEESEPEALEPGVVLLRPGSFQPKTIEVGAGDTVTWRWREKVTHNITGKGGIDKKADDSGTYTHTFDDAGRYDYSCTIHPGMSGTVVVE